MQLEDLKPQFFLDEPLPENASLAGWSALVFSLGIRAPVRNPACISEKHVRGNKRTEGIWEVFGKRYLPESTLEGHLNFALRHEDIDLLILKRIFDTVPQDAVEEIVKATPTGAFSRRIWFFYETLTGNTLEIEDAPKVTAIPALDPKHYFTGKERFSQRHRVRDNLLGTGALCPIIRRTEKLEALIALDLPSKANETIGRTGGHVIARAASFMLLADSRASFEIEGERPPVNRLERWGRAILEAGKRPLNQTEIYRLHRILIGDDRLTPVGYREDGVFLGERDHNNEPIPEFIGARADNVFDLMTALNECNNRLRITDTDDVDPVLQAAIIAFGFVYIHPLADGNGRLHRCLIHHVLAERKFTPSGMVFPVSSVMLDRIDEYREVLQGHSAPLMDFIDWRALPNGNIEVLNETADLYRFYDCTAEAEFLYECVQRTIEEDLPREIDYLKRHDEAMRGIMNAVEMPDNLAQQVILFVRQNDGQFPKRRRDREPFSKLSDEEITMLEDIVNEAFAQG
ncbi:cell filamentation protein Fic [Roseovarius sp. TE539]|uniref:Fic family protein n=1 Tax=Roseovarius sp. TE539 TaxID=2249812 RepID=UPI000DE096DA|nr:Fic family protein [Roseovarius sp. TE539]RBI67294.1 cell filamentation protein Fic [Roseovarius sp. TE539]